MGAFSRLAPLLHEIRVKTILRHLIIAVAPVAGSQRVKGFVFFDLGKQERSGLSLSS